MNVAISQNLQFGSYTRNLNIAPSEFYDVLTDRKLTVDEVKKHLRRIIDLKKQHNKAHTGYNKWLTFRTNSELLDRLDRIYKPSHTSVVD